MGQDEAQLLLDRLLKWVRRNERLRMGLAYALLGGLLLIAGHFAWQLIPRRYTLRISGGEILSNRHYFAKMLKESAYKRGLNLIVIPAKGSLEELDLVDRGELDLALVQGGLEERRYPNVRHVTTVMPELLHLLVKPGIESMKDLAGRSVNLGPESGGTYVVAEKVMRFSGLVPGDSFVARHYSMEQLASLHPSRLPDAVFLISTVPSFLAETLIRDHGYRIMEIPFPRSLALRFGWVVSERILAYAYNIIPPVPGRDTETVGVDVHLVCNAGSDPRAVFRLLEVLYSPSFQNKIRFKLDEASITLPSGFPLSKGTVEYLKKDNPVLSVATVNKLQSAFGVAMSVLTTIMVVIKFFLKKPEEDEGEKKA